MTSTILLGMVKEIWMLMVHGKLDSIFTQCDVGGICLQTLLVKDLCNFPILKLLSTSSYYDVFLGESRN
jgi:hypothetical protein